MCDTLPKWAFKHVQKCRAAFGIGHAGFVFGSTLCEAPGGTAINVGYAESTTRHERGGIEIRSDLARDDAGYEVLTHETLHVALGAQGQAVNQIIGLLPKRQRQHALHLWQDGNEQAVTRVARSLTPLLRATARRAEGDR